jgi:hypothetical protein
VSVARTSDSFSPPITCTCPVFTMYICFPTSPWKQSRTMYPIAGNFLYSWKWMVQNRLWFLYIQEKWHSFQEVGCCLAEKLHVQKFSLINSYRKVLDFSMNIVSGYRSRGPGFDSRRFQIFWEAVGLERGPLSLMRTIEELLEGKVAAQVYKTKIRCADHTTPSIRKTSVGR